MCASADLDALPKRHIAFDIGSRLFGVGVAPGSVWVDVTIDGDRVVARLPFPSATGLMVAKADELAVHRRLGKIVVAFDHYGGVAFSDHGVFPNCFHAGAP